METNVMNGIWRKPLRFLAFGCLLALPAMSVSAQDQEAEEPVEESDNRYRVFVERNPFNLKDPPPPPPPQAVTPPAKNDIKLTGITSFGSLKAYFAVTDQGNKSTENYALGVNQQKDGIEVLAIEPQSRSVRIRNGGIETQLTFATHGIAPPNAPAAGAPNVPGAPGVPGGAPGAPGGINPAMNMQAIQGIPPPPNSFAPVRNIPSRVPRTSTLQSGAGLQLPGGSSTGGGVSYGGGTYHPQPQAVESNMSTEEQQIIMEVNRALNPTLPPTPGVAMPALPGEVPLPGRP